MAVVSFEEAVAKATAKASANLKLSAEEKKLFENTLASDPELKEGWLRQDEFSRKLNEFSAKEKDYEKAKTRADELDAWAERNVPIWDGLVAKGVINEDGEEVWSTQKSELEKQLDDARKAAVAGADMKPEELDARVKEIVKQAGGVTKEEMAALIASEGKKLAKETFGEEWKTKEEDFNSKTIPFVNGFATATAVMAVKFEKETGEPWTKDRQIELHELMSKEKNFDPYAMVDKMIVPFRDKKARADEIKVEAEKLAKTMRAEQGGGGEDSYIPQPGDRKGALKEMLERSAPTEDFQALIETKAREAGHDLRVGGKV